MSKFTKIFILAVTHVIAFSIGGSVGFSYLSNQFEKGWAESKYLADQSMFLSWYTSYVNRERASGDIENYRQALITYIEALDHAVTLASPIDNEKVLIADKMFTYERLSRLEKNLGNIEKQKQYEQLAKSTCVDLGSTKCEIEQISKMSKRLE